MTEIDLKNRIGLFIIIFHFLSIILILILYLLNGFLFDEMTTTIALVIPMFSIYTTTIIKRIISSKLKSNLNSPHVSNEYVFITFFIPSLFIAFLYVIILLKAFNIGFNSFEEFKIMLAVTETAFGTYMGIVLSSLFDPQKKK